MTVRIYADFNNQDELGRVRLHGGASLQDIGRQEELLRPGLPIVLYTDENDYIEVDAVLVYDEHHQVWLADWFNSTNLENT
jgi:hypothetical protein